MPSLVLFFFCGLSVQIPCDTFSFILFYSVIFYYPPPRTCLFSMRGKGSLTQVGGVWEELGEERERKL